VRELALAFIPRPSPRPRSNTPRPLAPQHSPLNASLHSPHRSLIASDNPARIGILSDQREGKGPCFRSLQLKPSRSRLLIANPELELLASRTKRSLLTFSNRKEIAIFDPHLISPIREPKKLSPPLALPDNRCHHRRTTLQHISNRDSRFTESRSTCCKYTPYQISNRNKSAHFAFFDTTNAAHESQAASHESQTTTRAAFRSTIPARPHAYR
jgi:hypothetical protein